MALHKAFVCQYGGFVRYLKHKAAASIFGTEQSPHIRASRQCLGMLKMYSTAGGSGMDQILRHQIAHPFNAIMSVLRLNTCHVGDWECTTCAGDYNTSEDQPWQTKNADMVCTVCIARVFELALENDYTWPPRFGPDVLHTQDFASILPAELLDRIKKRLAKGEPRIDPEEVAAAVKGQVRGKDFQICPGCCNVINLKEACNHILCVCFAQFCYLCGQVATHDGDHFKEGGCPRWGQPKSEQAMFDQPDPMAEMRAAHNNRILQDFAQHRLEFHADIWT
jgi:hypothetical protein